MYESQTFPWLSSQTKNLHWKINGDGNRVIARLVDNSFPLLDDSPESPRSLRRGRTFRMTSGSLIYLGPRQNKAHE